MDSMDHDLRYHITIWGGGGIDESRLGEMILVGLYCFVDGKD